MPEFLVELFAHYGYAVIFAGVLLENAGVPAPGHTVVLAGAFVAQSGRLSIGWVFAVACLAAILRDNAGYWIGRKGGRAFIERHRRFLHISEERQRWITGFYERHGPKTVFIARFVTGLQTVGAVFAGMSRMHWPRFLFWNVLGASGGLCIRPAPCAASRTRAACARLIFLGFPRGTTAALGSGMTNSARFRFVFFVLGALAALAGCETSSGSATLSWQGQLEKGDVDATSEFMTIVRDSCDERDRLGIDLYLLGGRVRAAGVLTRNLGVSVQDLHDEDASAWRIFVDGEEQVVSVAVVDLYRPDVDHIEGTFSFETEEGATMDGNFVILLSADHPERGGPAPHCTPRTRPRPNPQSYSSGGSGDSEALEVILVLAFMFGG